MKSTLKQDNVIENWKKINSMPGLEGLRRVREHMAQVHQKRQGTNKNIETTKQQYNSLRLTIKKFLEEQNKNNHAISYKKKERRIK